MNTHFKKLVVLLTTFLFFIFFISSYLIYKNEVVNINNQITNNIIIQSNKFKEHITIAKSLIFSLKNSLETKFKEVNHSSIYHPAYESIKFNNKTNTFHLTNNYSNNIPNILFGIGTINDLDYNKKEEIYSALCLTPLYKTIMKIMPNTKWVYYTSKENFIYISPASHLDFIHDLKKIYSLPYWLDAIPINNPNNKLIVTDLYEDLVGKGFMITLSLPILSDKEFKGIVSIDIGIDTLKQYITSCNSIGEIYLVDENNKIIVSNVKPKTLEKKDISKNSNVKIEILKNELYLVNIPNEKGIREEAFYNSFWKILILFLILILTLIIFYLRHVLSKVQYLARTDSLTKLLNRRTLEREINSLINISNRHKQNLSFLLIDIDFFKKINDNFGHQVGDEALVEISELFIKNTRDYDVVGRYGGEEFLIALANTNIKEAFILAERIRENAKLIKVGKLNINLTISIGCTQLKENDTFFEILKRVDDLLYKAKETGRNKTIQEEEN